MRRKTVMKGESKLRVTVSGKDSWEICRCDTCHFLHLVQIQTELHIRKHLGSISIVTAAEIFPKGPYDEQICSISAPMTRTVIRLHAIVALLYSAYPINCYTNTALVVSCPDVSCGGNRL